MNSSEPVFELKDVFYSYLGKFPALCGTSLTVLKGQKIALLGANGTGKSTVLSMFDGLIFPDRGKFTAFGSPLSEARFDDLDFTAGFRKRVGFVFQNPDTQLFCPSVKEDIAFGPLQLGFSQDETMARIQKVSRLLEIDHLLERSCHQLSIGEKRKVAIATTLVIEPEVLLLDEPTAGLDPATTRHILDIIDEAAAAGKTIITSTHDLHLVEELADTIYVFGKEKRIVRSGPCAELLADIEFLQQNNLAHAHRHRHQGTIHTHIHQHLEHHHE